MPLVKEDKYASVVSPNDVGSAGTLCVLRYFKSSSLKISDQQISSTSSMKLCAAL